MDYEKAYKEARERATKVIMKCRPLSTEANLAVHYALSYVFPATTESEDERIGNLIYCIIRDREDVRATLEANGVSVDDALAYLEKHKEQKVADYTEELEKCKGNPLYFFDKYVRIKMKPAEWSDEDYKNLARIENLLIAIAEKKQLLPITDAIARELLEWLKPLRPFKQEWSEEDEKAIEIACNAVGHFPHPEQLTKGYIGEIINRLKSLRPQPHWKPSEEQMESLMRTITWLVEKGNLTDSSTLADLRCNLQKLM